jgi:autotransporter-associated beta strand protein
MGMRPVRHGAGGLRARAAGRRGLLAILGAALLQPAFAPAVEMTEIARFWLDRTSNATIDTVPNPIFIGSNPSAIAWDGSRMFIAGFNNGSGPVGITEIVNATDTGVVFQPTFTDAFNIQPAPNSRGYTGIALDGTTLAATIDMGEVTSAALSAYDVSSATPAPLWQQSGRGSVGVAIDPGYVVGGTSQGGEGVAWGTFGDGVAGSNVRRALNDPATGTSIYGFSSAPGAPVPAGFEWWTSGDPQVGTTQPIVPRDIAFDLNTGDLFGRVNNAVTKAVRTGANESGTQSVLYNTYLGNAVGQNLAVMNNTVDGDLVVYNVRDDGGYQQPFSQAIEIMDTAGTPQAVTYNFLDALDLSGPGYYDFSFDVASQTLAVLDFGNRRASVFRFGAPEPDTQLRWAADGTTLGGSGIWDAFSFTWRGAYGVSAWQPQANAYFGGEFSGTVTVAAGGTSVGRGMSFVTDGYVIDGDTISLDGADAPTNNLYVESAVTATITAPLAATAGLSKSGAGTLIVGGPISGGPLFVNNGTLLATPAASISSTPGIVVLAPGTIDVTQQVGGLALDSGRGIAGAGTVAGDVTIGSAGTVSPGSNLGTLTVTQGVTWASGGNYNWQIVDAAGTAGADPGWDLLAVGGGLTISATSADPFKLNLWSLSATEPDVNGDAANFSPTQGYTWTIASAAGGITGFTTDAFVINTAATNGAAGFANDLGGGVFSLAVSGNDLNLVFTPGSGPTDIVIDVASGTQTQSQAGYPTIASANSVTKTGAGTLVFDAANGYSGPTTVSAGTLQVANAAAVAASNVTVDTGATLAVASGTTMQSPSVIVDGGTLSSSTLAVNTTTGIAALAINAGTIAGSPTVSVTAGGQMSLVQDARVTVSVGGLSVDQAGGGGRIDLGAGQVSVATGGISAADLRADIIAGRNGGGWNGTTGITSSTAAASGGTRAVGYVVAGDGSATVSFAAAGDVDLSGQVNVFDLVSINSSGKYGSGTASVWSQGDFNYDGVTNVFDLVGINTAAVYGQGNYFPAAPSAGGGIAAVPEPATWTAVAAAGAAMAAARRRRVAAGHRPARGE